MKPFLFNSFNLFSQTLLEKAIVFENDAKSKVSVQIFCQEKLDSRDLATQAFPPSEIFRSKSQVCAYLSVLELKYEISVKFFDDCLLRSNAGRYDLTLIACFLNIFSFFCCTFLSSFSSLPHTVQILPSASQLRVQNVRWQAKFRVELRKDRERVTEE